MKKKVVIFTGGGSGGHVIPAHTLIKRLQKQGYEIHYIGGQKGVERELASKAHLSYSAIFTGKLRRYLSLENVIDIFKVLLGFIQSLFILFSFKRKNALLFSTGGFVSVPVVLAGRVLGFKIFIHEQTTRVGLANKVCSKFANKVFVSFEDSLPFFPPSKVEFSGYPLRDSIYEDSIGEITLAGRRLNNIEKPILFVTGGGNGSFLINELIGKNLSELSKKYLVVHQVGKKFIEKYSKFTSEDYIPIEFIHDEMIDLLKISKVIISRAGAGTVCELMALKKASLFIPLKIAQKNEQFHNAMAASSKLGSIIIEENDLSNIDLLVELEKLSKMDSISDEEIIPNGCEYILKRVSTSFS